MAAFVLLVLVNGLSPWADLLAALGGLLFFVAVGISGVGVVNGIMSYLKKEKHRADRFLILLGNLIIVGILMMIVLANVLDLLRFVVK